MKLIKSSQRGGDATKTTSLEGKEDPAEVAATTGCRKRWVKTTLPKSLMPEISKKASRRLQGEEKGDIRVKIWTIAISLRVMASPQQSGDATNTTSRTEGEEVHRVNEDKTEVTATT